MKEENTMIACCSDGTRPVIFKIERIDVPDIPEERVMEWARRFDAEIPIDMFGSEEYKRYLLGTTIVKFIADARKEVLA